MSRQSAIPEPAPFFTVTIDLEDWFQVENLRPHVAAKGWESFALRVRENVALVMRILDENNTKATFFVLGWLAERCPDLIREVAAAGHEIGSHGYAHQSSFSLTRDELLADIQKSKQLLEALIGKPVTGFRAPNFSLTVELINILEQLGFRYDASYNDFSLYRRYGKLAGNWHRLGDGRLLSPNGLTELPVSNLHLGGITLPWGGGAYFRLLPLPIFEQGVASIGRRQGYYLFYCHPWEFDPGQPYLADISFSRRFRHYTNLHKTANRLRHMLQRFQHYRFRTCSELAVMPELRKERIEIF